jgi:hypothetical protein
MKGESGRMLPGGKENMRTTFSFTVRTRTNPPRRNTERDFALTPHFVVSVSREPDVPKVGSVTDLCGLRVKVETYNAPKGSSKANDASASETTSLIADKQLSVWVPVESNGRGIPLL